MPKIILAGGSGFLGQALGRTLAAGGWEVVVLSRRPRPGAVFREVAWDGALAGGWAAELAGADALVNLTGRSINCVHTPANRREILESRLNAVRALAQGCARAKNPPPVWVQCSATGYYGNAGDRVCDESQPAGPGFLAETCRLWEEAFSAAELSGVRRVVLRIGVVLDAENGALPPLAKLARCFLGGAAGSGRQYLSWIHREDLLAIFSAALTRPEFSGTYNACSPVPVTNAGFMRELRAALHRPWCPPAPAFMVRFVARRFLHTEPDLALHGQRCSAARLQAAGLEFRHPAVGGALAQLLPASDGAR
jgi:uncharacterized protein (TIGR01777 family)